MRSIAQAAGARSAVCSRDRGAAQCSCGLAASAGHLIVDVVWCTSNSRYCRGGASSPDRRQRARVCTHFTRRVARRRMGIPMESYESAGTEKNGTGIKNITCVFIGSRTYGGRAVKTAAAGGSRVGARSAARCWARRQLTEKRRGREPRGAISPLRRRRVQLSSGHGCEIRVCADFRPPFLLLRPTDCSFKCSCSSDSVTRD